MLRCEPGFIAMCGPMPSACEQAPTYFATVSDEKANLVAGIVLKRKTQGEIRSPAHGMGQVGREARISDHSVSQKPLFFSV